MRQTNRSNRWLPSGAVLLGLSLVGGFQFLTSPVGADSLAKLAVMPVSGQDVPVPAPAPVSPIEVTLKADKDSYKVGEKITFTATAHNTAATPQTFEFGAGQEFDLTAKSADGVEKWTWSHNRAFVMMLRLLKMEPDETLSTTLTWEQVGNDEKVVPRGTYTITAKFATKAEIVSAPVTIELTN